MSSLGEIETLAKEFGERHDALSAKVQTINDEISAVKRRHLHQLRNYVAKAADAKDHLRAAIKAAPEFFKKPRTLMLHDVRVGFAKGKGKLVFASDAQLVTLIKKHFPDQVETLVKVEEKPVLNALANLPAKDLKRLGVTVEGAGDDVVIKPTGTAIDKLVDALIKGAEGDEEAPPC